MVSSCFCIAKGGLRCAATSRIFSVEGVGAVRTCTSMQSTGNTSVRGTLISPSAPNGTVKHDGNSPRMSYTETERSTTTRPKSVAGASASRRERRPDFTICAMRIPRPSDRQHKPWRFKPNSVHDVMSVGARRGPCSNAPFTCAKHVGK